MGYTKRIVCLAKSLKYGGLCIAGRELTPQGIAGWVRPVSSRPAEELTYLEYRYHDGSSPKLLDVIDIPLMAPAPRHHQIENHLIDPKQPWIKQREIPFHKLKLLVEDTPALWPSPDHTSHGTHDCISFEDADHHRGSLYLIENHSLTVETHTDAHGKQSCRGLFTHRGIAYNLSITDPLVRDHFSAKRCGSFPFRKGETLYLCVSLTEPYKLDRRCHKLIAAVITDPPLEAYA
jgi:hypothetical protein